MPLDEKILTKTADIEIHKDNEDRWHIRDYGRGLQYMHFTQNENAEKLEAANLIGKFGVGLKDALAVFNRHKIEVEIFSKFATISFQMAFKSGFDIETLHAVFKEPKDTIFIGTEFIITGIAESDIYKAKRMFLQFSGSTFLEQTKYGEVHSRGTDFANIYVNGVQVAQEDKFMFSYNITNLNAQIKKALNRERSNVGRTAYSDSIKGILTQCKSKLILMELVEDLKNVMSGTSKDESSWVDVSKYAAKTLNKQNNVVFLTPYERANLTNQQVEILEQSGKQMILITDNLKEKLGSTVTTFYDVKKVYDESFEYKFIVYEQLAEEEKTIFDAKENIIKFLERYYPEHSICSISILVSETIRINEYGESTNGVWESGKRRIIIKRSALTPESFFKVLLHEFAHYISCATDNTRIFENTLSEMLGYAMIELFAYYKS